MDLSSIDLNLLRAFHVLLQERHVTRAAAKLGISQPGMSNALSRLRELLDDEVLIRTPDGMRPTPRALEIAGPIQRALEQIETALLPDFFDPSESKRRFYISSSYYGYSILPGLLGNARKTAPNAEFVVRYTDLAVEFEAGLSDVILGFAADEPEECESHLLFEERLVCICSRERQEGCEALTMEEYGAESSHVVVTSDTMLVENIRDVLGEEGYSRTVAAEVSHPIGLNDIIAETDLIATVPERIAKSLVVDERLGMVEAPFDLSVEVKLFWHSKLSQDAGHRWLREQVIAAAK